MISKKIKDLRLEIGLTQKDLAQKIGSTSKNIWAYENNIATPPADVLIKLADFFNCSVDYLLGRADDLGNISISPSPALELTTEERELVETFRRMTKETQAITLDTVHSLAGDNERGRGVLNKRA